MKLSVHSKDFIVRLHYIKMWRQQCQPEKQKFFLGEGCSDTTATGVE